SPGATGSVVMGSGAMAPGVTSPDRLAADPAGSDSSVGGSSSGGSSAHGSSAERRPVDRRSAPGPRLGQVTGDHRAAGMDLREQGTLPSNLPPLQCEHLVRIIGELLTNAHRPGAAGPVHLSIRAGEGPTGDAATII